jgi:hypothetical protein
VCFCTSKACNALGVSPARPSSRVGRKKKVFRLVSMCAFVLVTHVMRWACRLRGRALAASFCISTCTFCTSNAHFFLLVKPVMRWRVSPAEPKLWQRLLRQYLYYLLVKQVMRWACRLRGGASSAASTSSVSICTFVLVKPEQWST